MMLAFSKSLAPEDLLVPKIKYIIVAMIVPVKNPENESAKRIFSFGISRKVIAVM
jgi:hypothetical protein